jgi:2-(1,2-epoxy-1,2-dihydrophenyl)acetyl-CoA isomerase
MSEILLTELRHGVLLVTLNRPERLNALNTELVAALNAAFDGAASDAAVQSVLLTGAGRGFCAGADLAQITGAGPKPDLGEMIEAYYNPLVRKMRALPKPILSAVNGVAAGAGMNLALAGDVIIASASANFTQAFVRIGLLPDAGGTYFLPRMVGDARARAMAMLGETLTSEQALGLGLIWKCFPDEVFAAEAMTLAANLAAKPPLALAAMKRAFNAAGGNSLEAQLDLECQLQRGLGYSADFAEGVGAFLEKRPAVFTGR